MTAVVVSAAIVLGAVAGLMILARGVAPATGWGPPIPDSPFDADLLYPVRVGTPVDYNGLLFRPGTLAPGETASGLVFFKARGADWTGLRLTAAL